jgi:hypothetical protein
LIKQQEVTEFESVVGSKAAFAFASHHRFILQRGNQRCHFKINQYKSLCLIVQVRDLLKHATGALSEYN